MQLSDWDKQLSEFEDVLVCPDRACFLCMSAFVAFWQDFRHRTEARLGRAALAKVALSLLTDRSQFV